MDAKTTFEQHERAQSLYTEVMELRMDTNDTVASIGQLCAKWKVPASGEVLGEIEAHLAKLTAQVAAMRALQDAVAQGTWKPKPTE